MTFLPPINLKKWIDEHRYLLRPPVGNQVVYKDSEFIIMIVGGPNSRTDYHVNEGEEFFYQLEGNMILKTIDNKIFVDVPIHEGEIFLLPPKTPHSPQRLVNTVGLVVERRRNENELDGFQWYCQNCKILLYEEYVHLVDIVTQLPSVFERFYNNEKNCRCKQCGKKVIKP